MRESRCPLSQTRATGPPRTPCPAHRARGGRHAEPPVWVFRSRTWCCPAILSGHLPPGLQLWGDPGVIESWARTRQGSHPDPPLALRLAIWPPHLVVAVCLQGWHRRDGATKRARGRRRPSTRGPFPEDVAQGQPAGCGHVSHPPGSWEQATKKSQRPRVPQPRGCVALSALWVNAGHVQQPGSGVHRWTENGPGSLRGWERTDHEPDRSSDTCCPGEGL